MSFIRWFSERPAPISEPAPAHRGDVPYITADQARKIASTKNSFDVDKMFEQVRETISAAANKGRYAAEFNGVPGHASREHVNQLVRKLESAGFTVTVYEPTGLYGTTIMALPLEISWEEQP